MGECYYHGTEVYPGHSCEECERKRSINIQEIREFGYRSLRELQGKNVLVIQQGKIDFRKHEK